jgi:hypothetical protein
MPGDSRDEPFTRRLDNRVRIWIEEDGHAGGTLRHGELVIALLVEVGVRARR